VQPGAGFTEAEIVDALCIKVDFARDGFYLDDSCEVKAMENAEKVTYHQRQHYYHNVNDKRALASMVVNSDETLGFLYDGSESCAILVRQALEELSPETGSATRTIVAPDWEVEKTKIRAVVRAYGRTVTPAKLCALGTAHFQAQMVKDANKSGRCVDVLPPGEPATYTEIGGPGPINPDLDGNANVVAVRGNVADLIKLMLIDGEWLIDKVVVKEWG
ncbi:MAG TPA: hypothetical protein PKB03_00900, partial [Baekduia sp.]|nr:hypothetical protein [Baekduia sp.]